MLTPEQLKEMIALTEEYAAKQDELSKTEAANARAIEGTLTTLQEINDGENKRLETLQKQLTEQKTLQSAGTEALEQEIEAQKKATQLAKQHKAEISHGLDMIKSKTDEVRGTQDASYTSQLGYTEKLTKATDKQITSIADAAHVGVEGAKSVVTAGTRALTATATTPELLAMGLFKGVGKGLEDVMVDFIKGPSLLDKAWHDAVKSTAMSAKVLGDTLTLAFDPLAAKRAGVEFGALGEPLHSLGFTAEETGKSMQGLIENVAMFRPSFMQSDKAGAIFMTNLVTGLSKIGVKTETSTKILDTFTKAMKVTPAEATKSLKSIVQIADSLGLSAGKVADNFQASTGMLSDWGDDMTRVFADLQAQSQATGISFESLGKFAMKLDTFEGAASAVGQMNAILGDTVLSATDLVHADPAEKVMMMQDALAASGVDFETADRRMRKVIATAMGFETVEEASRMLLNKDEALEAADALDTTAMSQEELKNKIDESLTSAEQITKGLSNMGEAQKKFLDTTRPGAVKFANIMTNAFADMLKSTENSMAAMILWGGTLDVAATTVGAMSEGLDDMQRAAMKLTGEAPAWLKGAIGTGAIAVALAATKDDIMKELEAKGGLFERTKVKTERVGTEGPIGGTTLDEAVTSIKDLTTALTDQSDVPINLHVEAVIDKEKMGEATLETQLNLINKKVTTGGP